MPGTPRPWTRDGGYPEQWQAAIYGPESECTPIAAIYGPESECTPIALFDEEDDALLCLRAVNALQVLVEALNKAAWLIDDIAPATEAVYEIQQKIEEALRLAGVPS